MSSITHYQGEESYDGPPRNVLSNETIRNALRAATASSTKPPSPQRTSTSRSHKSEKGEKAADCECIDCRKPKRQGTARTDKATGDSVLEWDGEGSPDLRVHVQPGLFDDEDKPAAPRRTSTGGSKKHSSKHGSGSSSGSEGRRGSEQKHTYTTRNKDGDLVEEYDGHEAPKIRTHYNWDAPENKQ